MSFLRKVCCFVPEIVTKVVTPLYLYNSIKDESEKAARIAAVASLSIALSTDILTSRAAEALREEVALREEMASLPPVDRDSLCTECLSAAKYMLYPLASGVITMLSVSEFLKLARDEEVDDSVAHFAGYILYGVFFTETIFKIIKGACFTSNESLTEDSENHV